MGRWLLRVARKPSLVPLQTQLRYPGHRDKTEHNPTNSTRRLLVPPETADCSNVCENVQLRTLCLVTLSRH